MGFSGRRKRGKERGGMRGRKGEKGSERDGMREVEPERGRKTGGLEAPFERTEH